MPPIDANCMSGRLNEKQLPNKFQGNPVKKKLLIHSPRETNTANDMYGETIFWANQLKRLGIAINNPKNNPEEIKTIGISHPKDCASISRA